MTDEAAYPRSRRASQLGHARPASCLLAVGVLLLLVMPESSISRSTPLQGPTTWQYSRYPGSPGLLLSRCGGWTKEILVGSSMAQEAYDSFQTRSSATAR